MDTTAHRIWDREPARLMALMHALLTAAAASGVLLADDPRVQFAIAAATIVGDWLAGKVTRDRVWAPATVEDLGVLDPDEDPTDPDAIAL